MQHLVKKQTIELFMPKDLDAFGMQHLAGKHVNNEVLLLLEQVFDELCDDGTLIEIDRLEINIGEVSEKDMRQQKWNEEILTRIRKQLYVKIGKDGKESGGTGHKRAPAALGVVRQWLFYMRKGYLPWNALQINEVWYQQVLEALAVDVAGTAALKKMIADDARVSRRIVLQHTEAFLVALLKIITATNQDSLPAAIAELQGLAIRLQGETLPASDTQTVRNNIWQQLIQFSITTGGMDTRRLIEKILVENFSATNQWQELLSYASSCLPVILPVMKRIAENIEQPVNEKPNKRSTDNKTDKEISVENDDAIDEDGMFVQHAGLVLVHPFISRLFKKLELVNEGKFETALKQQKALYVLYYLATGIPSAEEHELVVAKILCNWPLDMPVEKNIMLTEGEMEEADNMLEAAIGQWTVLKSTSLDGLREGFLQRSGKITKRNDKLYLQVEATAIDVLLDQLPWNMGMIKLPWMKNLLWVEWR